MTPNDKLERLKSDAQTTYGSGKVIASRDISFKTRAGDRPLCGVEAAAFIQSQCGGQVPESMPGHEDLSEWAMAHYRLDAEELEGLEEGFGWVGPVTRDDENVFLSSSGDSGYFRGFRAGRDLAECFARDQVLRLVRHGRVVVIANRGGLGFAVWVGREDESSGLQIGVKWFDDGASESATFKSLREVAVESEQFLDHP